ncbi:MAG: hypothetical protein GY784_14085 [Gammaproteobacteria bacterium]|nr:hypothetical protein [Gammaproteobacteria bacterium]
MNRRLPTIQSYWLMLIATVITVAIVTASQLITQRISLLLDRQASELLAADLVVVSNVPLAQSYLEKADADGLSSATTVSMRSAVFIDDEPQLVELKAVSNGYPLRGQLEIAPELSAKKQYPKQGPANGEVWVDTRLTALLGRSIMLGKQNFETNWLLTFEPDRGGNLFNLAPRVLMNIDDLQDTGLIIPGSRVRYRMLFSGSPEQIEHFKIWLKPRLKVDESIQDVETARPEMRRALERTRRFFALSIILTLVIAMVAIAITANYTAGREAPKVAILRAFGIAQTRLIGFYLRELGKLWLIASLAGILLGWLSQFPLQWALDGWFGRELPQVDTMQPFVVAALVGMISLAGFCLPYLLSVIATPPMQVFRPVGNRRSLRRSVLYSVSAIVTVFLILVLLMQSSLLAVVTLAVILVTSLMLPVIFGLLIRALLSSGKHRFWLKRYLFSRLRSSSRAALVVMSGFSMALLAILIIAIVKDELLEAWNTQLPDNIPNYFLINLAREDVTPIRQFLQQQGITASTPYPLVRTRLTAINRVPVAQIAFADPRAEHLINHTFNVSFSESLPDDNAIVEGRWMHGEDPGNQFSVEQGMAEKLGVTVGDVISLSVGADTIEAPISSIRTVLWGNFKPNFYLIANQSLIEHKPQTWLLSARIEEHNKPALKQLLQQFPAITLLDITILMARIQAIVDRASTALEFFFLFALASAFIVLLAAIQTGKAERQKESSLLRALSAQKGQLYSVHVFEFMLMGLLVGFFAALFASLAGWLVSVQFFDIDYSFSPTTWLYGMVSATLVLTIAGTIVSRKVYNISPMKILRS